MRTIANRHDPIVSAFRELADAPDATGRRLLLDGVHLIEEALDTRLEFELAAVAESKLARDAEIQGLVLRLRQQGVEVLSAADAALDAMSPVRTPSGIVAVARRVPITVEDVCSVPDALIVGAVDVQDPGNLGSLIRAADAGGATGMLVCGASANPFGWKALRGSMGSTMRLPLAVSPDATGPADTVRRHGVRLVVCVPRGGTAPDDLDWTGPCAIFLGGEAHGLPDRLIEAADVIATIPMNPRVESLNVAVAGALLVYAARRQRA